MAAKTKTVLTSLDAASKGRKEFATPHNGMDALDAFNACATAYGTALDAQQAAQSGMLVHLAGVFANGDHDQPNGGVISGTYKPAAATSNDKPEPVAFTFNTALAKRYVSGEITPAERNAIMPALRNATTAWKAAYDEVQAYKMYDAQAAAMFQEDIDAAQAALDAWEGQEPSDGKKGAKYANVWRIVRFVMFAIVNPEYDATSLKLSGKVGDKKRTVLCARTVEIKGKSVTTHVQVGVETVNAFITAERAKISGKTDKRKTKGTQSQTDKGKGDATTTTTTTTAIKPEDIPSATIAKVSAPVVRDAISSRKGKAKNDIAYRIATLQGIDAAYENANAPTPIERDALLTHIACMVQHLASKAKTDTDRDALAEVLKVPATA